MMLCMFNLLDFVKIVSFLWLGFCFSDMLILFLYLKFVVLIGFDELDIYDVIICFLLVFFGVVV